MAQSSRIVPRNQYASLDGVKSIEEAIMKAQVYGDTKVLTALAQLQKIINNVSETTRHYELVRKEQEKAV